MTYGEAIRLVGVLSSDPTSHFAAAVSDLAHPVGWQAMVTADLIDTVLGALSKNAKPYVRSWAKKNRRAKPAPHITQADIRAALREAGHTMPFPDEEELE